MKKAGIFLAIGLLAATSLHAQERRTTNTNRGNAPAARAGAAPANSAQPAKPALTAKTQELASYAIGYDLATRLKTEGAQVNVEALIRGLKDSLAGSKPGYPQPELQAAVEAFDADVQARAEARFREMSAKNQREGAAYLAKNKTRRGVTTLPSGLQYEVLKSGQGKSPSAGDIVRAHYHGTLIDGTVFDSTQNSDPIEIAVEDTIPGWAEVLQRMKVGDKWRLTVPPELAYGEQGYGPVPPQATLIFEIELLDVKKPQVQQSARPRTVK